MDGVSLAGEERVLAHPGAHHQIAAGAAERPRAAFAGDTDLHTGIDAGRDVHRDRLAGPPDAAAGAGIALPAVDAPGGAAGVARRKPQHLELGGDTARHLGEFQLDRDVNVVAPATGAQRRIASRHGAEAVVHRARLGIAQHAIRLGDLLEQTAGGRLPEVDVRGVLPRETPVGLPDLARPRGGRDAEHRVVIPTHGRPYFFSPKSSNSASTTSPSFGPPAAPVRPSEDAPPAAPEDPAWPGCACASRYMISASLCDALVSVSWARFMRSRSSVL